MIFHSTNVTVYDSEHVMMPNTQPPHHFVLGLALVFMTLLGSLPGLSALQVIDRDEARYAQASQQMLSSGDYVNIRFHDRDRHKKPAGIYWAQTAMLKLFSGPNSRDIWAHRLPSILAGLIAILGVYWAGLSLYDRKTAFMAALLFSSTVLLIFESHMAKTDATICACAVWIMGAILYLRQDRFKSHHARYALILWIALGIAVIVKGPIIPALLATALLTSLVWDWRVGAPLNWLRKTISPLGICLFGIITLPWFIMIGLETNGAFYGAAIGDDLAPKLTGGQEKHGGYPGYYLIIAFAALWPAALFLPAAISYGFRVSKGRLSGGITQQNARWLLCWIIPFWIILELIPTKLPHYILPLCPAIALLMAGAVSAVMKTGFFKKTRLIGAAIFFVITAALVFVVAYADSFYGADRFWVYGLGVFTILAALLTAIFTLNGHMKPSLIGLLITGLGLSIPTYGLIMPGLNELKLAPRLAERLNDSNIALPRQGGPLIRSPHFTEPSLIYYLGTNILLGEKADNITAYPHIIGQVWIIDLRRDDAKSRLKGLQNIAQYNQACLKDYGIVSGVNYSKGDNVELAVLSITACDPL